jgi:hypothetical protein
MHVAILFSCVTLVINITDICIFISGICYDVVIAAGSTYRCAFSNYFVPDPYKKNLVKVIWTISSRTY